MRIATGSSKILKMSIQRASYGIVVMKLVPMRDAKLEDIGGAWLSMREHNDLGTVEQFILKK
jgi:hypothetical protein